jgi:hypothetical protein
MKTLSVMFAILLSIQPALAADLEFSPRIANENEASIAASGYIQGLYRQEDIRLKKNIKKSR